MRDREDTIANIIVGFLVLALITLFIIALW